MKAQLLENRLKSTGGNLNNFYYRSFVFLGIQKSSRGQRRKLKLDLKVIETLMILINPIIRLSLNG